MDTAYLRVAMLQFEYRLHNASSPSLRFAKSAKGFLDSGNEGGSSELWALNLRNVNVMYCNVL